MSDQLQHPDQISERTDRRQFLQTVGAGALTLGALAHSSVAGQASGPGSQSTKLSPAKGVSCKHAKHLIFLHLSGGPSHLDTFDPKPHAPLEYRSFDGVCQTAVPGVFLSENLPQLARRAGAFSLVRTLFHDGPVTHAAGLDLIQSHLLISSAEADSQAKIVHLNADPIVAPSVFSTPSPTVSQDDVVWNRRFPRSLPPATLMQSDVSHHEEYGPHHLGMNCRQACQLIGKGVSQVVISQFMSVYDHPTWDMHANGGRLNSSHLDYRNRLCPELDQALSALLDDLTASGLIDETLVVVLGEMGRTPKVNAYGGRDHHTGCWSGLIAGGPVQPGRVIGRSDEVGEKPRETPIHITQFLSTLSMALGKTNTIRGFDTSLARLLF